MLSVSNTPAPELITSNHIYVHPGTLSVREGYIFVSGTTNSRNVGNFIFSFREHTATAIGTVAFNKMQRTCARLSPQVDHIPIKLFTIPSHNFSLSSCTFEIEYANAKKAPENMEMDIVRVMDLVKGILVNQVLSIGQHIGIEINGIMIRFKVIALSIINEDMMGLLMPDSRLIFKNGVGKHMRFTNIPKESEFSTQSNLIKTDFNFSTYGIGGLDSEADQVFRRAFASRIFPSSFLSRLGVSHVKGILLYGPPGCGKNAYGPSNWKNA